MPHRSRSCKAGKNEKEGALLVALDGGLLDYLKDLSCKSRGLSCLTQEDRSFLYIYI